MSRYSQTCEESYFFSLIFCELVVCVLMALKRIIGSVVGWVSSKNEFFLKWSLSLRTDVVNVKEEGEERVGRK